MLVQRKDQISRVTATFLLLSSNRSRPGREQKIDVVLFFSFIILLVSFLPVVLTLTYRDATTPSEIR